MNTRNRLILPLKALNSPPVCAGPSANTPPCQPASLHCRRRSLHRPSFHERMRARVFMWKRVRVRVPVSFPSAPGYPAALALQRGAAVCAVGAPLWGEPAQSSGCDGRERRSDGGALYGSTALPAVESAHTHTHTHAHTYFTLAASPNEKPQRMCVNDESQRLTPGIKQLQRLKGARKTR